jgi:protease-4
MSMLEEIGNAIDRFKESGKPVVAFAPGYSQTQYYLAAHADDLFLDSHSIPAFGGVFITGFGVYPTYFKAALDKLKVRFHVFRVGEYKGAVEPYTRNDMSPASKEANLDWVGDLWQEYEDTIIRNREITQEQFRRYTNEYDVLLGEAENDPLRLAAEQGMVDDLLSHDEFESRMQAVVGTEGQSDGGFSQIGFRDYLRMTHGPIPVTNPTADKVAVITAKGMILDGDQPPGDIGSAAVTRLIRQAREDQTVKAIVLRVDSPGGSAPAAEQIRHELELTQQSGKPVVVSMSGYAASGGYWISATANRIFANATTVTGSIGTFIIIPKFNEALGDWGISTDGVGTTALSGALDPFQPINPVLQRTLERSVDNTYRRFIELVARGREMTPEDVDEIAQGRVWSGEKALELGLVDAIGSLNEAITSAALLADVSNYDVLYLEKELSTRDRLLNEILNDSAGAVRAVTGPLNHRVALLERLSDDVSMLMRMSDEPGVYLQCLACNFVK